MLRKALNDAEGEDILPLNPIRKIASASRPRPAEPDTKSMAPEQVAAFLKATLGDPYQPLYVLALDSGMREGELFALEWTDFDLDAGTVRVQRELSELDGKVEVLNEAKTKASKRVITLTPHTVSVLRASRSQRREDGFDAPLVFTAPQGGHLRRPNLAQRFFQPALKKAGLPRFRFHELRHTCATLLLMAGVPVKVVSEWLGHQSVQVTLKVYAHVMPGMQQQAAEKMDALLTKAMEAARKAAPAAQAETETAAVALMEQALPGEVG